MLGRRHGRCCEESSATAIPQRQPEPWARLTRMPCPFDEPSSIPRSRSRFSRADLSAKNRRTAPTAVPPARVPAMDRAAPPARQVAAEDLPPAPAAALRAQREDRPMAKGARPPAAQEAMLAPAVRGVTPA